MDRDSLNWVAEHSIPKIVDVGGRGFCDKKLREVLPALYYAEPLALSSLTALRDYITKTDDLSTTGFFVHVVNEREVRFVARLDERRERELFAVVKYTPVCFPFEKFLEQEEFMIKSLATLAESEDREILIDSSSFAKIEKISVSEDDRTKQSFINRKGYTLRDSVDVPSPVLLRPFRTFHEVEQPQSPFIFRIKEVNGVVMFGLFECDGGLWRLEAVRSIVDWIGKNVDGVHVIG